MRPARPTLTALTLIALTACGGGSSSGPSSGTSGSAGTAGSADPTSGGGADLDGWAQEIVAKAGTDRVVALNLDSTGRGLRLALAKGTTVEYWGRGASSSGVTGPRAYPDSLGADAAVPLAKVPLDAIAKAVAAAPCTSDKGASAMGWATPGGAIDTQVVCLEGGEPTYVALLLDGQTLPAITDITDATQLKALLDETAKVVPGGKVTGINLAKTGHFIWSATYPPVKDARGQYCSSSAYTRIDDAKNATAGIQPGCYTYSTTPPTSSGDTPFAVSQVDPARLAAAIKEANAAMAPKTVQDQALAAVTMVDGRLVLRSMGQDYRPLKHIPVG